MPLPITTYALDGDVDNENVVQRLRLTVRRKIVVRWPNKHFPTILSTCACLHCDHRPRCKLIDTLYAQRSHICLHCQSSAYPNPNPKHRYSIVILPCINRILVSQSLVKARSILDAVYYTVLIGICRWIDEKERNKEPGCLEP